MKKKSKGNWIKDATDKQEKKGTKGSYGHHSEKEMDKDVAKGGKLGKKANFARNMAKLRGKKSSKRARKG